MRHSGIFVGEQTAGSPCFSPDRQVTRGEFTAMLAKALDLKPEEDLALTGYTDEIPTWLQPYLAAAVRSGLTAGLPQQEAFGPNEAITGAEAAVMLQNALDLTVSPSDSANAAVPDAMTPVWAEDALNALSDHDMDLDAYAVLSRGDASQILYQAAWMMDHPMFTE
jgi:hypothetical protein